MICPVCSDFDARLDECLDADRRTILMALYGRHIIECHPEETHDRWWECLPLQLYIYDQIKIDGGHAVLWTYSRMVAMTRMEWERV